MAEIDDLLDELYRRGWPKPSFSYFCNIGRSIGWQGKNCLAVYPTSYGFQLWLDLCPVRATSVKAAADAADFLRSKLKPGDIPVLDETRPIEQLGRLLVAVEAALKPGTPGELPSEGWKPVRVQDLSAGQSSDHNLRMMAARDIIGHLRDLGWPEPTSVDWALQQIAWHRFVIEIGGKPPRSRLWALLDWDRSDHHGTVKLFANTSAGLAAMIDRFRWVIAQPSDARAPSAKPKPQHDWLAAGRRPYIPPV